MKRAGLLASDGVLSKLLMVMAELSAGGVVRSLLLSVLALSVVAGRRAVGGCDDVILIFHAEMTHGVGQVSSGGGDGGGG